MGIIIIIIIIIIMESFYKELENVFDKLPKYVSKCAYGLFEH
jgi:hypothetical protein